jgi:hypothetical protein
MHRDPKPIASVKESLFHSMAYETAIDISAALSNSRKAGEAAEEFLRASEE